MSEFIIPLPDGLSLKGESYLAKEEKASLVLITGMCEHGKRYKELALYLNTYGFSVYVVDHFGQGLNAESVDDLQKWPKDAFDMTCLALKMKGEEIKSVTNKPVYLFGHSMGSFVSQRTVALYPSVFDKVILCGSNGPDTFIATVGSLVANILTTKKNWDKKSKLLTGLVLGQYVAAIKNRKHDNDWLSINEDNVIAYDNDPYCGATPTHGFFKEFLRGLKKVWKKKYLKNLSKSLQVLIIGGECDPVGHNGKGLIKLDKMYKKYGVNDVTLVIYPNLRHEILNEKEKHDVYEEILRFLQK